MNKATTDMVSSYFETVIVKLVNGIYNIIGERDLSNVSAEKLVPVLPTN